jgi:hypothetical protein
MIALAVVLVQVAALAMLLLKAQNIMKSMQKSAANVVLVQLVARLRLSLKNNLLHKITLWELTPLHYFGKGVFLSTVFA